MKRMTALYAEHEGKKFYPWLLDFFRGKPVEAFILEKKSPAGRRSLHKTIADIVGDTNPRLAEAGTIRSLSDDDMDISFKEGRAVRNLVHRSRTAEESMREGSIFFFDWLCSKEENIRKEPFALELTSPLNLTAYSGSINGLFFEERLTDALKKISAIPRDSSLIGYKESLQIQEAETSVLMEISYIYEGKIQHRELPVSDYN